MARGLEEVAAHPALLNMKAPTFSFIFSPTKLLNITSVNPQPQQPICLASVLHDLDDLSERVFVVGDGKGWTIIFDYQAWAEGKDFRVGDKLVFNYPGGAHTVLKVNGTGFQNCIKPPASEALTSGSDEIVLATPGRKWYICGVGAHCKTAGQKLFITVQPQSSSVSPAMTPPVQSNMAVKDTVKYQLFFGVMVAVNYHSGLAF
ncbi:hypothetical protein QYF36_016145 [Acer negundo]|nr:hypothetical protein QYF36_016145 [Acer negundo]